MNLHQVAYSSGNGKSRCNVCLASKSDLNSPKFLACLQVNGHMLAQKTQLKQKKEPLGSSTCAKKPNNLELRVLYLNKLLPA